MSKNGFIINDDMFGAYVKIPTGASGDMNIYKVIGRIESNGYCDIPITGGTKATTHKEIVPVLNVVHCGVCEDTVIRVALSDCEIVPPPNDPLTLEELREMDEEPIYVHWIGRDRQMDGEWAFVCLKWRGCKTATGGAVFFDRYGEWWLAYRRKPEDKT